MKEKTHLLKECRLDSKFLQQDVATLLQMNPSNLNRYESDKRQPTPEIILTYHILFGKPLKELFSPLFEKVENNLLRRSQKLLTQISQEQKPKSTIRISYLHNIVKDLTMKQKDGGNN